MQALTLFNQNFAVAESLLQLYQVFHGLRRLESDLQAAREQEEARRLTGSPPAAGR